MDLFKNRKTGTAMSGFLYFLHRSNTCVNIYVGMPLLNKGFKDIIPQYKYHQT